MRDRCSCESISNQIRAAISHKSNKTRTEIDLASNQRTGAVESIVTVITALVSDLPTLKSGKKYLADMISPRSCEDVPTLKLVISPNFIFFVRRKV